MPACCACTNDGMKILAEHSIVDVSSHDVTRCVRAPAAASFRPILTPTRNPLTVTTIPSPIEEPANIARCEFALLRLRTEDECRSHKKNRRSAHDNEPPGSVVTAAPAASASEWMTRAGSLNL